MRVHRSQHRGDLAEMLGSVVGNVEHLLPKGHRPLRVARPWKGVQLRQLLFPEPIGERLCLLRDGIPGATDLGQIRIRSHIEPNPDGPFNRKRHVPPGNSALLHLDEMHEGLADRAPAGRPRRVELLRRQLGCRIASASIIAHPSRDAPVDVSRLQVVRAAALTSLTKLL